MTKEAKPATLRERAQTMTLYLEPEMYERLRTLAFVERTKMHPLIIEAIGDMLKKRTGRR